MDSNLTKFLNDLEKETVEVLTSIDNKIKGSGVAIQESLMKSKSEHGTPVITKHLRNNWVVTIDQEYSDVSGSKENPDDSLQKSNLSKFLNTKELYLHHNLYFNNNVYYGPWVNYGAKGIIAQKFREKAIQSGDEYLKVNTK